MTVAFWIQQLPLGFSLVNSEAGDSKAHSSDFCGLIIEHAYTFLIQNTTHTGTNKREMHVAFGSSFAGLISALCPHYVLYCMSPLQPCLLCVWDWCPPCAAEPSVCQSQVCTRARKQCVWLRAHDSRSTGGLVLPTGRRMAVIMPSHMATDTAMTEDEGNRCEQKVERLH